MSEQTSDKAGLSDLSELDAPEDTVVWGKPYPRFIYRFIAPGFRGENGEPHVSKFDTLEAAVMQIMADGRHYWRAGFRSILIDLALHRTIIEFASYDECEGRETQTTAYCVVCGCSDQDACCPGGDEEEGCGWVEGSIEVGDPLCTGCQNRR